MIININGEIVERESAKISVFDHGFLFGDSVYEVVRTHKGKLFTVKEHLQRLERSGARLKMSLPLSHEEIEKELWKTYRLLGIDEAYLRIIITRGVGDIDLHPSSCIKKNYIIFAKKINDWGENSYKSGIKVAIVSVVRNDRFALDPQIKSGNYLNNVLAIIEAKDRGADEGVMCNKEGFVTEGTNFNIFMVKNKILYTPELASGLLEGITRMLVIRLARENNIEIIEKKIPPEELRAADEVFMSSTTRDIMPVNQLDDVKIDNAPGEITTLLMRKYADLLENAVR